MEYQNEGEALTHEYLDAHPELWPRLAAIANPLRPVVGSADQRDTVLQAHNQDS